VVIPITGDMQPNNPIRPKRVHSRDEDEGRFEELLVDRVESVGEGEQGGEEGNKSFWGKRGNPNQSKSQADDRAAGRETQGGEAEGSDSLRGRKIDLRA
jgi:hypothetical protein